MAGCYGKVPALGDFLSRNLPAKFVEAWDGWLRKVMAECARRGPDGWADAFVAAPAWRFAMSPGTIGEVGRAGVLVPSVDRIGRCFPMTVLVEIPAGVAVVDAPAAWADGFDRAEALVLAAIGRSLEPEAFVTHVEKLPGPIHPGAANPPPSHWRGEAETGLGVRSAGAPVDPVGPRDLATTLALRTLEGAGAGCSLWWHPDWDSRPATTALFAGLPPPEAAGGMLIGPWEDWGWRD